MTITATGPGYLLPHGMFAEWRATGTVQSVSKRIVTVVAVPYDERTAVVDPDGREYTEEFDRHAFDGIQTRSGKIPVNRDHDVFNPIGQAIHLYPNRREGLIAELRMTDPSRLGDETLALARDGLVGASISFGVPDGGADWSDQGRHRRVTNAWLDHIALTAVPAYPGAEVLDVRSHHHPSATSATPRLDQIIAERREAELRSRFNLDD